MQNDLLNITSKAYHIGLTTKRINYSKMERFEKFLHFPLKIKI